MYGLGHRPDNRVEESASLGSPSAFAGSSALTASERDWRFLDSTVYSQDDSSTCVAQSASMAVFLRGQAAALRGEGPAVKRPSVLQGYLFGQLEDQRLDGIPLHERKIVDAGMRARSLLLAWQRYGIASEEYLPFDTAFLKQVVAAPTAEEASKLLPFDIDVAAADAKLTGWKRIEGPKSDELALALDVAHMPIMAIRVHENFQGWDGRGVYREPAGKYVGNHMMAAVAFRPGAICFRNSWGSSWGDGGHVWIASEFLDGLNGLDAWRITAAPPLH